MLTKTAPFLSTLLHKNVSHYGITPQFLHPLTADSLLDQFPKTAKRTKTVCTIGPRTQHPDNAVKLINEGMNVARLNFSHGDHAQHLEQMKGVQEALKRRPHSHTSICLDTKGPQIRTGRMVDDKPIILKRDQLLQLTTDYGHMGTPQRIACSYQDLATSVQVGKKILFADGSIESVVKKIENGIVTVHVINDGKLGSKKNMCLPGVKITLPTLGEYDTHDIAEFGLKNKVDFIAVSFARYETDLIQLRKFMFSKDPEHGPNIHLISKIESHEAIHNLDEIIRGSDGIMIARGDLGMEVPIQKVVLMQKYVMHKTIDAGKYVVCATQMLQSMQTKPRPTRAEVSDITNAVLDLADATMTSGQTTNGLFPTECARMLRKIAQETQVTCAYKRIFDYKKTYVHSNKQAIGAIALSFELIADLIFIQTDNVKFINQLSALRPRAYICVFTDSPVVKHLTAINFGVYCFPRQMIKYPDEFVGTLGQDFIPASRPEALILHLELDSNLNITNHRVSHHKKPDSHINV